MHTIYGDVTKYTRYLAQCFLENKNPEGRLYTPNNGLYCLLMALQDVWNTLSEHEQAEEKQAYVQIMKGLNVYQDLICLLQLDFKEFLPEIEEQMFTVNAEQKPFGIPYDDLCIRFRHAKSTRLQQQLFKYLVSAIDSVDISKDVPDWVMRNLLKPHLIRPLELIPHWGTLAKRLATNKSPCTMEYF